LPLSFVPRSERAKFAEGMREIYRDLDPAVAAWVATSKVDLAIAWVAGFKPRGDDARPDRGLPPLARMLVGDSTHLMTLVYGPAPQSYWIVRLCRRGRAVRCCERHGPKHCH